MQFPRICVHDRQPVGEGEEVSVEAGNLCRIRQDAARL